MGHRFILFTADIVLFASFILADKPASSTKSSLLSTFFCFKSSIFIVQFYYGLFQDLSKKPACEVKVVNSFSTWIYENKTVGCKTWIGLSKIRKACPGIWQSLTNFIYLMVFRTGVKYNILNKLLMADTDRKWQESKNQRGSSHDCAYRWIFIADIWPRTFLQSEHPK